MTASKPIASEPSSPSPSTGRDGPDETPQVNDAAVKSETHDVPVQARKSASRDEPPSPTRDEPSQKAPMAEADESKVSRSNDATAEPTNSKDESAATATAEASGQPTASAATGGEDDGWGCHWDQEHQAWFFYNSITKESTWDNPRVPSQAQASAGASAQAQGSAATAAPPAGRLPAGGYNPAIHGDYDPNAWYAKNNQEEDEAEVPVMDTAAAYAAIGSFNRFTGRWQGDEQGPDRHNDEAKSRRQMNAFFDVDAAANAHNGRSLKAERAGKKPTKSELKQFKEKRRAKKEEKRRAWLRD